MSLGSSRYLIRCLEEEFSSPSSKTADPLLTGNGNLLNAMDSYAAKHNTYYSNDSAKLGNELYKIYVEYVMNDYTKEKLFVQVLTKLIHCIVDDKEFLMWIKKYLKPSTDCAGLNKSFVDLTRDLINDALLEFHPTEDEKLINLTTHHSLLVLNLLLDDYFKETEEGDLLDKPDSGQSNQVITNELSSQELEEKRRFTRLNIRQFICSYALRHTKEFLQAIADHWRQNPQLKLEVMSLLSSVLKAQPVELYSIIDTDLWQDIISCLLVDPSIDVVDATINFLCIVIPHICNKLGPSLHKLFIIFARRLCWSQNDLGDMWTDEGKSPMSLQRMLKSNAHSIPTIRLESMLYGLYPLNLIYFCKTPVQYLGTEDTFGLNETQFKSLAEISLKRFLFHENFIRFSSTADELEDTKRFTELGSPSDIAIYCSQFDSAAKDSTRERRSIISAHSESISTSHSALLSLTSAPGFRIPDFAQPHRNHKASIASISTATPENSDNVGNTSQDPLSGLSLTNRPSVSTSVTASTPIDLPPGGTALPSQSVHSLLDIHKDLYYDNKDSIARRKSLLPESGIFQVTSAEAGGRAIDFYQRELLILINELDFAEYVRNLSIANAKKARGQIVRLNMELEDMETLKLRNAELTREVELLRKQDSSQVGPPKVDNESLVHLLGANKSLKAQVEELRSTCELLTEKYKKLEIDSRLSIEKATNQEREVVNLRDTNSVLVKENITLKEQADVDSEDQLSVSVSESLNSNEKEIYLLKRENETLQSELNTKSKELAGKQAECSGEPKVEKAIADSRLEKYIAHYQKTLADYKQTIKDLEAEIQTKDSAISELHTSQPINIPVGRNEDPEGKLPQFTYESSFDVFGNRIHPKPDAFHYNADTHSPRSGRSLQAHGRTSGIDYESRGTSSISGT
ncbi:DEKNAAC102641 [Brettanomyces naardenensis]|uniref:DEKNAAC102641 n=1 Tax=Brettanomyces naardenensis TaxID=13370 RepID=A0A448YL57_BRENA|nr:DEKNAAC102641 [Brettanomyces naardenensis]